MTYLTRQTVKSAIKEYWLCIFQQVWVREGVFIPARFYGPSENIWNWISTILEVPVREESLRFIEDWKPEDFPEAITEAENLFMKVKRNRVPIRSQQIFRCKDNQLKQSLAALLSEMPEELVLLNRELILGTSFDTVTPLNYGAS